MSREQQVVLDEFEYVKDEQEIQEFCEKFSESWTATMEENEEDTSTQLPRTSLQDLLDSIKELGETTRPFVYSKSSFDKDKETSKIGFEIVEVCKEDYGNRDALEEEHDPGEKKRILLLAYHQELCFLTISKVMYMRLASCLLFPNNVKTRIWKPGEQDGMEKGEQLNSQNQSSREVF